MMQCVTSELYIGEAAILYILCIYISSLSVCLLLCPLQLFECQTPLPLNLLEAYVVENEEYPIVVLGVKERSVPCLTLPYCNVYTPYCFHT